jgi:hypothetical protein
MNATERYLFDLQGYLHIPSMLSADEAGRLLTACHELEKDALACRDRSSRWQTVFGAEYWRSDEHGYFAYGEVAEGKTLLVEDFWCYPDAFDLLVCHERTMDYIRRIVQDYIGINNSEMRVRCPGNSSPMHMGVGNAQKPKYRYEVVNGQISCGMVRMVYFLHDVGPDDGPMCFVPASHKGQVERPAAPAVPHEEAGNVGVPVRAGDAVLFTEACRHGGLPITSDQNRYTLHVGYGPAHQQSQNISTMDEDVNVTEALLSRLSAEQRALLVRPKREAV